MKNDLFLVLLNDPIPITFNLIAKDYESILDFMDNRFDSCDYETLSASDITNLNDYININGEGTYCICKITEQNKKIDFNKIKYIAPEEMLDLERFKDYVLFSKKDLIIAIVGFIETIEENNRLGKVEVLD